ncbi:MAG: Ni,Fe-hydrogenase I large subunit [Deltaproteobacteria bacterium]|nr:Ni,Fe-hydrogenase I large subunit [Deltaproteobacteria bacterium]
MSSKNIQVIPLNRSEGDLEIHLEMDNDTVSEARSVGTMYRGFENLLKGRAPLDGLVITPRICGICTTAHLKAAVKALDMMAGVPVPDDALRVRNLTLMAEQLQNDLRHSFLLFTPDFAGPAYRGHPLYTEALKRYRPIRGRSVVETVRQTKKIIEIIAILGGQWPHSSFMVPGGVVSVPGQNDISQCRSLLANFRHWYERRVLGCTLARWSDVRTPRDLGHWLHEKPEHRESDLGFFIRFSREARLQELGKGHDRFISYGAYEMPARTALNDAAGDSYLFPPGLFENGRPSPFDQEKITEDVTFSHFKSHGAPRHPFEEATVIEPPNENNEAYSWGKAPRYDGKPAETGPLAELVLASDPLIKGLLEEDGPNVFLRQLARLIRPALLFPAMDCWLGETGVNNEIFYIKNEPQENGRGFGLVQAHRGALGHWVTLEGGKISQYQVITPTTWNASPRDGNGIRGPWEEALVGTLIKDPEHPVEIEHTIRSFDPCMVCCVHAITGHGKRRTSKIFC